MIRAKFDDGLEEVMATASEPNILHGVRPAASDADPMSELYLPIGAAHATVGANERAASAIASPDLGPNVSR